MQGTPLFRILALASISTAFFFVAQSASADPSFVVSNEGSPIVIKSDAGTVDVTDIKVTNNEGSPIEIVGFGSGQANYYEGNPGDVVTGVSTFDDVVGNGVGNCYVGRPLANTKSCTVELALTVSGEAPTSSHPAAVGVSIIDITVGAKRLGEVAELEGEDSDSNLLTGTGQFAVEVDYAATPEPGSLLLLGTGMLGLAGVVRRKLSRG
jgi:hypothetical protein